MHPTLLIDFARDLSAERIRTAQRERLVRARRADGASRRGRAGVPGLRAGVAGPRAESDSAALVTETTAALMEVPPR